MGGAITCHVQFTTQHPAYKTCHCYSPTHTHGTAQHGRRTELRCKARSRSAELTSEQRIRKRVIALETPRKRMASSRLTMYAKQEKMAYTMMQRHTFACV